MISGIVSTPWSYPFFAWSDEKNVHVSIREKGKPTIFKKSISHLNPKKVEEPKLAASVRLGVRRASQRIVTMQKGANAFLKKMASRELDEENSESWRNSARVFLATSIKKLKGGAKEVVKRGRMDLMLAGLIGILAILHVKHQFSGAPVEEESNWP